MNKIKVKDGVWLNVTRTMTLNPWVDFYDDAGDWIGSWIPIDGNLSTLTYDVSGVMCLRDALSHF